MIFKKMPPRVKKAYTRKQKEKLPDSTSKEKELEDEKENEDLGKNLEQALESENGKAFNKLLKSPLKQKVNFKPLGFWSQKLKDLEPEDSFKKPKKHGLYEFSGTETDETGSPHKRKKKVKRKTGPRKKKAPVMTQKTLSKPKSTHSVRKIKQIHSQSLFREQIILTKEREKLADKGEKFTFSTGMTSLGITSTPAVNKDNLVGASNFLFISPIINEECPNDVSQNKTPRKLETPKKSVVFETPKVAEKRTSCRRVLRNGKIL